MKLLSWLWVATAVCAQDIAPGKLADAVRCADGKHSYSLYLPSKYASDKIWPVLFCLDPGARGKRAVERFAKAAEAEGFIVAGSLDSRNGPIQPVREAIEAMVNDVGGRFNIGKIYAAGLSGGARVALSWAANGMIAGVVACSAGFGDPSPPKKIPFDLYATAGRDDFNYSELRAVSLDFAKRHIRHRFVVFEGGHEWLPEDLALEALRYFNGKVEPLAAVDSKEERKQDSLFRERASQVEQASGAERQRLLDQLKKEAALAEDSQQRRVARRVLGLFRVREMETRRAPGD